MSARYKKCEYVEAVEWTGDNEDEIVEFFNNKLKWQVYYPEKILKLNNVGSVANIGDFILCDDTGYFICKSKEFYKTYELVE